MNSPFRIGKLNRIRVKCYYCDSSYYMPYDIIGNALLNHFIVEHPNKVDKEE